MRLIRYAAWIIAATGALVGQLIPLTRQSAWWAVLFAWLPV